mgnify:CR=1 FL=1
MFESKKLMKCDIDILKAETKGLNDRIDRLYERVNNRFEIQNTTIRQLTDQIELLTKQIKQLAHAANCKITSPTEATPGGEVKKLTEEEIASRDSFNRLFGSGLFYTNPYLYMTGKSVVSDLQKGKTSKKTTKKKKK